MSIFGFALIIMGTWEAILATVAFGLGNGGPGGLIWTYVASYIGFGFISFSMAEMASMAPTSGKPSLRTCPNRPILTIPCEPGGQYHWVSEFAPPNLQKVLSYYIGWFGILGYQIGTTIGAFVAGTMIQGLIVLNDPDTYHF